MPRLRIAAIVLLLLAGVAARRAAGMPWASESADDGSRVEASPIGLVRHAAGGGRDACRWHSGQGDVALCAPAMGQARAYYHLELAAPLLALASWLLLGAGVLGFFPVPGAGVAASAIAMAGAVAAGAAAWFFSSGAADALGRSLVLGGRGWVIALLLPVIGAATAVILWRTRYQATAGMGEADPTPAAP